MFKLHKNNDNTKIFRNRQEHYSEHIIQAYFTLIFLQKTLLLLRSEWITEEWCYLTLSNWFEKKSRTNKMIQESKKVK